MPLTQWNLSQIKQCEKEIGQAMLSDEHSLFFYSEDFGKLTSAKPKAVCIPKNTETLQKLLHYANSKSLPLVVRGKGLSQGGQSIPVDGGMTLHLDQFNQVLTHENNTIWVEANASWSDILTVTLTKLQAPYVVPYNCNLSVGGVLSAGGVGASSFQNGSVTAHVEALEVITADGTKQIVNQQSELFNACLAGQGRFGVITKACIKLRPCKKMVRTFLLTYNDREQWFHDLMLARQFVDGIEAFCSPAIQGARLTEKGRFPFAEWLYALHLAVEYDNTPPNLVNLTKSMQPWKHLHTQDESIESYFHRHDSRFAAMKMTGQWDLQHPWYECFVPADLFHKELGNILDSIPVHYANVLQVVPVASNIGGTFFMVPETQNLIAVMILNPGVHPVLLPSCIAAMAELDARFLKAGGKRYLSGFLGQELNADYWKQHFNGHYDQLLALKNKYDPNSVFQSKLHEI